MDNPFDELLTRTMSGEPDAEQALSGLIYDELHRIAERLMAHERSGHTLQPTALVHEVYLRLGESGPAGQDGRDRFLGLACRVMRNILVDHARGRNRLKRGGPDAVRVALGPIESPEPGTSDSGDILALHEALGKLAALDERKARLVELRFFGGLGEAEAARVLGVSRATASSDWRFTRAWLAVELGE